MSIARDERWDLHWAARRRLDASGPAEYARSSQAIATGYAAKMARLRAELRRYERDRRVRALADELTINQILDDLETIALWANSRKLIPG